MQANRSYIKCLGMKIALDFPPGKDHPKPGVLYYQRGLAANLPCLPVVLWHIVFGTPRSNLVRSHRIHGTGILCIFTYIYHEHHPNVGKYTIYGSSGDVFMHVFCWSPNNYLRLMMDMPRISLNSTSFTGWCSFVFSPHRFWKKTSAVTKFSIIMKSQVFFGYQNSSNKNQMNQPPILDFDKMVNYHHVKRLFGVMFDPTSCTSTEVLAPKFICFISIWGLQGSQTTIWVAHGIWELLSKFG